MKVYKIFNMKDGKPHALFVNAQKELPIGEWIPAEDTPHYTADNGRPYVKGNKGQALAYRPWLAQQQPPLLSARRVQRYQSKRPLPLHTQQASGNIRV